MNEKPTTSQTKGDKSNEKDQVEKEDDFTEVKSRKKRKVHSTEQIGYGKTSDEENGLIGTNKNPQRPVPEIGTREEESELVMATQEKYKWIFISSIALETKSYQIQKYLRNKGITQRSICIKLKTKADAIKSSFKYLKTART
ncbi:hypothetical protein JTB14_030221 [Gonioctena quinquepunctata]|nr:hypothetical protein JTB14_030221 [Gonioctena quinquepunctata]